MCQLGLFKTYLYCKGNDAMIKDFKLKVLICFKSPITTEMPNTSYLFPHSFTKLGKFWSIGRASWKATNVL